MYLSDFRAGILGLAILVACQVVPPERRFSGGMEPEALKTVLEKLGLVRTSSRVNLLALGNVECVEVDYSHVYYPSGSRINPFTKEAISIGPKLLPIFAGRTGRIDYRTLFPGSLAYPFCIRVTRGQTRSAVRALTEFYGKFLFHGKNMRFPDLYGGFCELARKGSCPPENGYRGQIEYHKRFSNTNFLMRVNFPEAKGKNVTIKSIDDIPYLPSGYEEYAEGLENHALIVWEFVEYLDL